MIAANIRLGIAFLIALILTIIPLPELLMGVRPPWVLMLVLYLQFYLPEFFKLRTIFLLGLILDVLLSTVIGEHAFALALVTWVANNKARRFYFFSIGQQMALVGVFCFLYQLLLYTIDAFLGFNLGFMTLFGSPVMSIILWPWVRLLGEETLYMKASQISRSN